MSLNSDLEFKAISTVLDAIKELSAQAKLRVLDYCRSISSQAQDNVAVKSTATIVKMKGRTSSTGKKAAKKGPIRDQTRSTGKKASQKSLVRGFAKK